MNNQPFSLFGRASAGARPGGRAVRSLAVVVCLFAGLPGVALAARTDLNARYQSLQVEVADIVETATRIDRNANPGRGFITRDQAIERYQEFVFLHLIGEHERAAEGFYSLVTTVALDDAGLHRDAEWYLSESLYKLGNLRTAEANYRIIVDDGAHPFREDAVRRLLEIYVDLGDEKAFQSLYNSEILSGRVRSSDLITYAVGKAFFRRGDYVQAKSSLGEIGKESAYYRKARYIFGSIMVIEGNLEAAARAYREIVEQSVETQDDRKVLDLSLLALGRIYMELGLYEEASSFYARISSDSPYLADKLYEEVWTLIKQKEEIRKLRTENATGLPAEELVVLEKREVELIQQVLRGIDIFLLAFPEHPYTPKLKLLEGHMHIQAVQYDSAMRSYENVVSEYAPIRERFGEFARSDNKPQEYFKQILEKGDSFRGTSDQLPPYAVGMVLADRDLSRALNVYRDVEDQRQTIAASEAIIAELVAVLQNATGIGGFDAMRYDLQLTRSLTVQRHFDAVALEEDVLLDVLSGEARKSVEGVRARRNTSQNTALEAAAAGDWGRVREEVANLRKTLAVARMDVRDPAARDIIGRLDALHQDLDRADGTLAGAETRLGPLEADELERIKKRFDREVAEVEKQRGELGTLLTEAQEVSVALTRSGFGRLEDFFAESVLRADVGIVDVYWAQKVQVSEEKTRVLEERNALRDQISQRFDLIEQKLRQ